MCRNLECVNLLLNIGADFNRKDNFGRSVCFFSLYTFPDDAEKQNFNLVFCFYPGRTPLHYASTNCNYQCVFALAGSGASINELDLRGCSALHYAAAVDTDGK